MTIRHACFRAVGRHKFCEAGQHYAAIVGLAGACHFCAHEPAIRPRALKLAPVREDLSWYYHFLVLEAGMR